MQKNIIDGLVETFDGITDSQGNILICSSHVMMESIMDTVNEGGDTAFYGQIVEGSDIKESRKSCCLKHLTLNKNSSILNSLD